ncbi:MAG TPA: hypothetical protein VFH51_15940, partial [Myxococcota bacterium]|nr:hypothetical protein [Myxococcota bacterium]
MPRFLVFMVLLPLGLALVACKRPSAPPGATLVLLSELQGVTEPCGCTSRPLGGLDRAAGAIEALAQKGATGLFVVGNTFFTDPAPKAEWIRHERDKGAVIAGLLARLAPLGVRPGESDAGPLADALTSLPEP